LIHSQQLTSAKERIRELEVSGNSQTQSISSQNDQVAKLKGKASVMNKLLKNKTTN
jgi:uncharacterized coiled-coil protein SlyX